MTAREQLAAARDEVARLERLAFIEAKDCAANGHVWAFRGGRNCGCPDVTGCSLPVHECVVCGDFDYGDNAEAVEIRRGCEQDASDAFARETLRAVTVANGRHPVPR